MSVPDRVLNVEDFRALIQLHGFRVRYDRAFECPCRNPNTGDFSRNCPLMLAGDCNGQTAYRNQVLPAKAKVYFDRAKKPVDDSQLGMITVGDIMAYSMPDWVPLEQFDRLTVLDYAFEMRETRQRGETNSDPVTQKFGFALDAISWLDGSGWVDGETAIGDGIVTDAKMQTDDATGVSNIVWQAGGKVPAPGTNYTVIYRYRPTMYVSGISFMPSRPAPIGLADPNARYGLPIRALMTLDPPQRNS